MAIVFIQDLENANLDRHDAVAEKARVSEDPPEGLILHTASPRDGGGLKIVDVWESREACERFQNERIRPAVEQVLSEQGEEMPDSPPPQEILEVERLTKG